MPVFLVVVLLVLVAALVVGYRSDRRHRARGEDTRVVSARTTRVSARESLARWDRPGS